MKKILVMAAFATFALAASAQRASSSHTSFRGASQDVDMSVHFGIRAGLNVSNIKSKEGSYSENWGSSVGYHVGVIADVPLAKNYFYITPGLYFTQKGSKESEGKYEYKVNPMYLEIPILFSGRYTFGKAQLQVNFGPYFAVGVAGKEKETEYGDTEKWDFFGDDGAKRFDAGLSVGAGVTIVKHYYIGFQYEAGLANLYDDSDEKTRNKNFMISVGYNF
ncbi:MAG: PorT family protein [Prevotellaceae bacterium]|nr:PorT family protein [Prevotellaceae bacterium]